MGIVEWNLLKASDAGSAENAVFKKPLKEDAALAKQLKISKEDIRTMKMYNFFAVT